jgi:Ca2+/Na+ antiporter
MMGEFLILLLLITAAAALLSYGAEVFSEKFGAHFTGSILLALITTLPEYLFVFWAAMKAEYAMAVGSAVGACSMLITLGYGLVIIFATTRVSRRPVKEIELSAGTRIDAIYLMVTAAIAFLLAWEGGSFDLKDGIILSAVFVIYVVQISRRAILFARDNNSENEEKPTTKKLLLAGAFLGIGGIAVFFLSEPFVDAMLHIAHGLGISPAAIAIILGPFASEMPEKITAYITVIRNGRLAEISVCNFIGSKVNHNSLLLAILPLVAFFKHQGEVTHIITTPFIIMTVLTIFVSAGLARRRLSVRQGVLFALLYLLVIWGAYMVRSPS